MKQNYYVRNSDDYIYGALMRESTTTYSTPQTRVIHVVMITASCQSPRTDPITLSMDSLFLLHSIRLLTVNVRSDHLQ